MTCGRYQLWPERSLAVLFFQVWPNHLWPTPTLAKLNLANTNFGQTKFGQITTKFGQHHICVSKVGWGSRFGWEVVPVGAEGRGPRSGSGDEPRNMEPQRAGPEGCTLRWGPSGGALLRWALRGGGPKISPFFFFFPSQLSFFLSGCRAPAAPKPLGFHTTARESPDVHI